MTDTTFPSSGDVIDKTSLRRAFKLTSNALDYVYSGFAVSDGGGLNASLAAGEALVNGVYIHRTVASTRALSANSTNYVYVGYDDANQNALLVTSNTTGTSPGVNYILLATVVTGAASITSITDKRNLVAISGWGATA